MRRKSHLRMRREKNEKNSSPAQESYCGLSCEKSLARDTKGDRGSWFGIIVGISLTKAPR